MHTLTDDDLMRQPRRLIDEAQRGEPALVTHDGQPVLLALPLGTGVGSPEQRLELAVSLYAQDLLSLGLAAKVADLPYGLMVDELGRRRIPVVRYSEDDLDQELANVRNLGRG